MASINTSNSNGTTMYLNGQVDYTAIGNGIWLFARINAIRIA